MLKHQTVLGRIDPTEPSRCCSSRPSPPPRSSNSHQPATVGARPARRRPRRPRHGCHRAGANDRRLNRAWFRTRNRSHKPWARSSDPVWANWIHRRMWFVPLTCLNKPWPTRPRKIPTGPRTWVLLFRNAPW